MQELAEKSSALGDSEHVRRAAAHRQVGSITEGGRRITDRGQADAGDSSSCCRKVDFVDTAWLEFAVEDDSGPAGVRRHCEPPAAARQPRWRVAKQVANGERR